MGRRRDAGDLSDRIVMACSDVTKWLFLNHWMSMSSTRASATVETEFARNPTAVGAERQILGVRW